MGWVDRVPRCDPSLYIGGLHALYQRRDLFDEYQINYIISVLDFSIYEAGHFKEFEHMHISIDDDPNENLLQYFKQTNDFIDKARENKGAVFVHCAMGKSRSATIVCAYLMHMYSLTPQEALNQLCEGRPVCGPNPGFMEQLDVYHQMLKADDKERAEEIYRNWYNNRFKGDAWEWHRRHLTKL